MSWRRSRQNSLPSGSASTCHPSSRCWPMSAGRAPAALAVAVPVAVVVAVAVRVALAFPVSVAVPGLGRRDGGGIAGWLLLGHGADPDCGLPAGARGAAVGRPSRDAAVA